VFILRNVSIEDLEDLYELSGKVLFINLPHDKEIIKQKILRSNECFHTPSNKMEDNYYIFVLEDLEENKVIGVSMIHAQHGTEKEPHFFLRVSSEHKYSQTINTGFVHGTLRLGLDTNGPTEIGGLVLNPKYRGNAEKLGKQISFVRFLYMGIHADRFKETIHSELMPPFDKNGKSPLWEAIGRRFMNMDYDEADKLSRSNKEFILSLFPSNNIYMTLLPYEARNAVGKVGKDTLPVKRMLEKIGFHYTNEVDPFDGGPHYRCKLKDITLIQQLKTSTLAPATERLNKDAKPYLISFQYKDYPFFCLKTQASFHDNKIILPQEIIQKFDLKESTEITAIPF
jgi:arginine N-succinyltransferase